MRMKKEVASVAAVNVLTKGAGLGFLRSKASSSSSGRAGGGGTPIEILSPITPAYRERESGDGCFIHETCVACACLPALQRIEVLHEFRMSPDSRKGERDCHLETSAERSLCQEPALHSAKSHYYHRALQRARSMTRNQSFVGVQLIPG